MKRKKNFIRCFECNKKNIDCYCDLDKKSGEAIRKTKEIINKEVRE